MGVLSGSLTRSWKEIRNETEARPRCLRLRRETSRGKRDASFSHLGAACHWLHRAGSVSRSRINRWSGSPARRLGSGHSGVQFAGDLAEWRDRWGTRVQRRRASGVPCRWFCWNLRRGRTDAGGHIWPRCCVGARRVCGCDGRYFGFAYFWRCRLKLCVGTGVGRTCIGRHSQ
jgi:hypothetical protein